MALCGAAPDCPRCWALCIISLLRVDMAYKIPASDAQVRNGRDILEKGDFVRLIGRGILAFCGSIGMAQAACAGTVSSPHIEIVAGMYGMPGKAHVLDITAKLQDLCGAGAERCSVFCSDSSFGRYSLGPKPICRVTYRCGADYVHSVEALREEPLIMRCPQRRDLRGEDGAVSLPAMTN